MTFEDVRRLHGEAIEASRSGDEAEVSRLRKEAEALAASLRAPAFSPGACTLLDEIEMGLIGNGPKAHERRRRIFGDEAAEEMRKK